MYQRNNSMHDHTNKTHCSPTASGDRERHNADQSLAAIQYARRLQKITTSIETFFQCQVDRLESTLAACQTDVERSEEIQQTLASFALQKQNWETERQAESARLDRACTQLAEGWKQLEEARREWLTRKSDLNEKPANHLNNATENSPLPLFDSTPTGDRSNYVRSPELNSVELETLRQAMNKHRAGNC